MKKDEVKMMENGGVVVEDKLDSKQDDYTF